MDLSSDISSSEPLEFTRGSTVKWNKSLSHYQADDGWLLTYAIRGRVVLDVSGVANGPSFSVVLSASQTDTLIEGDYWWQSYVSKNGERFDVGSGKFKVLRNYALLATGPFDGRTHEKKVLDALKATLEGRATTLDRQVRVNGKQVEFYELADILVLYDKFSGIVASQENSDRIKNGGNSSSNVFTRFSRG